MIKLLQRLSTKVVPMINIHTHMQRRPKLKTFFLTIVLEGLEDKYTAQFSRG